MANNFNSDFNSTIPEQRSLFFLRCHSEHAQPCAIQDQDCQSLAIKTCTLHSHVLSLSSKYLNFYLLFFNSFPPFFPLLFFLIPWATVCFHIFFMLKFSFLNEFPFKLKFSVSHFEWIFFQAHSLPQANIFTAPQRQNLFIATQRQMFFTATQIKLQLIIGLNHPRVHASNQTSAHNWIKPSHSTCFQSNFSS